jgi:hypothetical protein
MALCREVWSEAKAFPVMRVSSGARAGRGACREASFEKVLHLGRRREIYTICVSGSVLRRPPQIYTLYKPRPGLSLTIHLFSISLSPCHLPSGMGPINNSTRLLPSGKPRSQRPRGFFRDARKEDAKPAALNYAQPSQLSIKAAWKNWTK